MTQTNPAAAARPRITVIDPRKPEAVKLRIAAYARVSSDSADQINSYLAQVDFYTKYISSREDWEMVDIYADEGLSGLESRKREEFNRMIADCRAGKIDRVLVKSTSRFARNTTDYIRYVRELLRLGISNCFEKENIDTGKMTSEQIAQIYGAFSQMESTNHSSNMRVSVRMRMEKGLFVPPSTPYGYRLAGRELEIVPEEAEVVRYIYNAYLKGQGVTDIAQELNELGAVRGHNRDRWHPHTIQYIRHDAAKAGCPVPQIPEEEITAALLRLYHKLKQDEGNLLRPVLEQLRELRERELRSNRKISDIDKEIAHLSEQNLVLTRLKSKGYVDSALYLSQEDEIRQKLTQLRRLRRRLMDAAGEDVQIQDTGIMLDYLEDGPERLDKPRPELFESLVSRIVIVSADMLKFKLRGGLELPEVIERTVR